MTDRRGEAHRSRNDEGRDERGSATCQACPEPPAAGRGKQGSLPRASRTSAVLPTLGFQTSGLQDGETIISRCCEPAGLRHFITAALGNEYGWHFLTVEREKKWPKMAQETSNDPANPQLQ